MRSAGFMPALG